jgi:hypothetical protein
VRALRATDAEGKGEQAVPAVGWEWPDRIPVKKRETKMPNWCENYLGVAGPYKKVQAFIVNARGTADRGESSKPQPLCFQMLYPAETSQEEVPDPTPLFPDSKVPAWYKDRLVKWGCKWDANFWDQDPSWTIKNAWNSEWYDADHDEEDDDCCAIIWFDTAWAPPIQLFDKVAQDYPDLVFRLRYKELMMDFKGVAEWRGGVQTKDECSSWEAIDALDWN